MNRVNTSLLMAASLLSVPWYGSIPLDFPNTRERWRGPRGRGNPNKPRKKKRAQTKNRRRPLYRRNNK